MIPVGEVVFVAFIWIFCRHRVHSELLAKLSTSICHLNALQLMTAAVFLAIAYSKCQESDWFHTLFVLHIAAVSIWSTLLAATIIPGWFTTKISQFPALIACFVLYGIELDRLEQQISAAHEQECFTDRPYIIPLSWMRFGFVFVFAFLFFIALFNRETSTEPCNSILRKQIANWKSRYLLLLQFLPFFGIGVGFYATFYSYSARKWILSRSEDDWTAGQIMPLCFVVVGSVADVWNIFELDGKPRLVT
jgi:hypothetical protein